MKASTSAAQVSLMEDEIKAATKDYMNGVTNCWGYADKITRIGITYKTLWRDVAWIMNPLI